MKYFSTIFVKIEFHVLLYLIWFSTRRCPEFALFPLEIPVFPTVTAKVTFTSFDWRDDIDDTMFVVPPNYRENPNRFPDL